jgi:hypothetical protein
MLGKKIFLRALESETGSEKKISELMRLEQKDHWRTENRRTKNTDGSIFIYFYEEGEENDLILLEGESEYDPDWEVSLNLDQYTWEQGIYKSRLLKASEWMLARQDSFQKCQEAEIKVDIYVLIRDTDHRLILPAPFLRTCGQLNLDIELDFL